MLKQVIPFFLALAGVAWSLPDPCQPGSYQEIDEKERSTGFMTQFPATPMCDINLQSGWYRFTSQAGGMMPETCVAKMQCGTIVPVWLNGTHPSVSEGMVARTACANFDTGDTTVHRCCEHSITIGVKNCGDFYLYYLKAVPSCPIAYCAGDRPPCPVGKWSPTGFEPCKDAFPNVTTTPVLGGPEIINNSSFRFSCQVRYPHHDPDQAFDVVWTFDGQEDPNIPHVQLTDPQRVAYLPGTALQGHLGTSVGCNIRSRYVSNGNMTSPWLHSNTYWAGIRTSPAHVVISEKQETQNVTLTSTIPILCDHTLECCLTMKVDVDGPKDNAVSAHACEYYLCDDAWNETSKEASVQVPITASKDQVTDGDKDLLLSFEKIVSAGGGPYLQTFDNYKPQNVPIDVKDVGTKSCSWTGDPHIHGMNHQGTYHLFKVGDYTMFESQRRDMEIQARTWPCNGGRVTCICGITIREKDDVIRISECDQPYRGHHTSPKLEIATDLREGTVVQRSTDGKHFTVFLPSGTEVKVDGSNFYLNTYLTIPSIDEGEARGICGTFDGVDDNEFMRRDGGVERECSSGDGHCVPQTFTESWRNDKQTSLFETLPARTNDPYVPRYCSCDKDYHGDARVNCTARGDIPRHNLKCSVCHTVTGPIPSFLDPTQGWSKRSPVYVDQDEKDPKFDPDHYKHFQVGTASWPTPSGITESQARARCQQALQDSQLWSHCRHLPHVTDINIIDCVTDIMYGDNFEMVEAAVASFLTECQSTLSRDPANYVTDASGKSVMKPELSDDVCSVFCHRHGHCVRGRCVCNHGYGGENCHLLVHQGPQLAKIRSNNTCDVTKRPCRKIFIDATNLEDTEHLACRTRKVHADGSVSSDSHTDQAEFLSAGRLACPLPSLHGQAVTTFSVSATNDGHLYGNTLSVTVYDGTCLSCDQKANCTLLPSTCLISGTCYQDADQNPANAGQICASSSSTAQWTDKPTPASGNYPDMAAPTLTGPDDDFQMECALHTSTNQTTARFQVTWKVDGQPIRSETLTSDFTVSFLAVSDLPPSGSLTCAARSFYEGQSDFSPFVDSNNKVLAAL